MSWSIGPMPEDDDKLVKVERGNRSSWYRSGLYRRIDSWATISNCNPPYIYEGDNEKLGRFRVQPFSLSLSLSLSLCTAPLPFPSLLLPSPPSLPWPCRPSAAASQAAQPSQPQLLPARPLPPAQPAAAAIARPPPPLVSPNRLPCQPQGRSSE